MSLTLYYHPLSSFCHKVLVALYENDTAFDSRIINLAEEMDRAELLAVSPLGKFPVIRDHARKRDLAETTIIIEYLDHYCPGEGPLIPREWADALHVRLWDQRFSMADCGAAPALFYAGTVQSFPQSLTHLTAYFDRLMERPSVQRVMAEAKPYFQFYPFADAIPKRFL